MSAKCPVVRVVMTQTRYYILATAGHVDHGKSALVKALTGIDPDRLPEEKARGITLELGFAHIDIDDANGARCRIGIVDVPGHEDFVKTMVAGVGSIDLALLIVAADDGWMPQTEEHLQILSYLGIPRAVVALTKSDLVADVSEPIKAVCKKLQGTPFSDAPVVPVSVFTGDGLEELRATLSAALASTPPAADIGKPRLPVDRVFTLRGTGTVVTGTLTGGILKRGDTVVIQPRGITARVRTIQSYNKDVEQSRPGTRTALNLPDIAADRGKDATGPGVRRGEVITLPELGSATDTLDVLLEKSARLLHTGAPAARSLEDGTRVQIHHGSGRFAARVYFLDHLPLNPGEHRIAELRAEEPVFAFAGDRFIVRDWSEQATLGGGVVLDPDAVRRRFRSLEQNEFLAARATMIGDAEVCIASLLRRDRAAKVDSLLLKSRFSSEAVQSVWQALVQHGDAAHHHGWLLWKPWWTETIAKAAELVDAEHQQNPHKLGLGISELRAALLPLLPDPELFGCVLVEMNAQGFLQSGMFVRRATHQPALPANLQKAGTRLRNALASKPLEPPSRKELVWDAIGEQALRFLIQTGEVVELNDQTVLLGDAFERARETVQSYLRQKGSASVSELKQQVGSSRRIMVPLLEKFDRDGVTRRQGDLRVLRG